MPQFGDVCDFANEYYEDLADYTIILICIYRIYTVLYTWSLVIYIYLNDNI